MNSLNYDFSKSGERWVSCFDRLGFGNYSKDHDLITVVCKNLSWLEKAKAAGQVYDNVELVWFSDTIIFYSTDNSRRSFQAVDGASRLFFDEQIYFRIPLRGALAFGDFYADKINNIFVGKALVDAHKFGENFDWLGFALHPSALKKMAEVDQPEITLPYKRLNDEFKNRITKSEQAESVVAYLLGDGSMPLDDGNSYVEVLEEMAACTVCKSHKRKYVNTIEFLKHFNTPDSLETGMAYPPSTRPFQKDTT